MYGLPYKTCNQANLWKRSTAYLPPFVCEVCAHPVSADYGLRQGRVHTVVAANATAVMLQTQAVQKGQQKW
jgi:hypothetical protein